VGHHLSGVVADDDEEDEAGLVLGGHLLLEVCGGSQARTIVRVSIQDTPIHLGPRG
jgi:hypothetical protein